MPNSSVPAMNQSFVMVTTEQLKLFQSENLSGLCMRVYIAIQSFAWNGRSCFPSIKSIAERMGYTGSSYKTSISKCLRTLEKCGLIIRNHKQSKERFILTNENERLSKRITKNVQMENINIKLEENTTKPSIISLKKGDTKTKKPRMSKMERRQKRFERKMAQIEENREQERKKEETRKEIEHQRWVEGHLNAQDKLITKIGSHCIDEQVSLVLARIDYEHRPELWTYEPPKIEEIGIERRSMALKLRSLDVFRNPFFDWFGFGFSLDGIAQWFTLKTSQNP